MAVYGGARGAKANAAEIGAWHKGYIGVAQISAISEPHFHIRIQKRSAESFSEERFSVDTDPSASLRMTQGRRPAPTGAVGVNPHPTIDLREKDRPGGRSLHR